MTSINTQVKNNIDKFIELSENNQEEKNYKDFYNIFLKLMNNHDFSVKNLEYFYEKSFLEVHYSFLKKILNEYKELNGNSLTLSKLELKKGIRNHIKIESKIDKINLLSFFLYDVVSKDISSMNNENINWKYFEETYYKEELEALDWALEWAYNSPKTNFLKYFPYLESNKSCTNKSIYKYLTDIYFARLDLK